jgi:hypothetical protein
MRASLVRWKPRTGFYNNFARIHKTLRITMAAGLSDYGGFG